MNENLPRKRPKIFLEMAKIYPGNGSGGPGNMPWGPWNIPWISINAKLSLRATKNARDKVVEVICLLHRIWFPDIQGNLSPFLHMFPGRFFLVQRQFQLHMSPRIREPLTFCKLINHAGSQSPMSPPWKQTFLGKKCTVILNLPIWPVNFFNYFSTVLT